MRPEDLTLLLSRLAKATKNQPTTDDIDLMCECILDNRLTDEEIERGYVASRDASEPWWPKPGVFLSRARPPASVAVVQTEANRLFDLIRDNPGQAYGRHSPEVGTIRDRRLIERAHGPAAGLAFVAAGGASAFGGMSEKSEPWVRKAFSEAYEAARADHGAPLTLDPARLLTSRPAPVPLLQGAVGEEGEERRKFRELVGGFREISARPRVDVASRVEVLRRQAAELESAPHGAGTAA